MFELDFAYSALLIICLIAACSFEFVNGFHDTANAVATVIYTNSLKPWVAVIWSGFCNFIGVFWGGIAVAVGIINLLPVETLVDQNIAHSLSMVMALLITAIFWNLLTWYFGIPCSSSHTLIGSILGVGLAYSLLPEASGDAVNWGKAQEIGISLLISPLFGFSMTIILMYLIRTFTKKTSYGDSLFKEPKKNQPPPLWIRSILVLTCSLVSFFHGSNDGQKGVGLIMLILIGVVPAYFALDESFSPSKLPGSLTKIEQVISSIDSSHLSLSDRHNLLEAKQINARLQQRFATLSDIRDIPKTERFQVRKDIMIMDRELTSLSKKEDVKLSEAEKKSLKDELKSVRKATDYSPTWVLLMISLSLGLGTMIGWKRIVKTVGEKIGKEHLTYAQGASAELVAASTIGLSSYFGLPVSTTHVLSSGIAGSMVANRGVKNLQPDTVRNILIAWFLTLPVVMIMAGTLFLVFRSIF
ncbi:inorganic phosphate transporter, PiT family [Chryseolinea serpens]|uniref:Phosphate transporter n=1 Tax=Chryseolinea serpens TaxID=947013 RepID=A0A1M5VFJ2_9BACT|nr:inorganic phosphate transporter [Chryseolinea serpens]SHH74062.1 inorganic phosphate transporter, PiT family [Chryseolinea serpens]